MSFRGAVAIASQALRTVADDLRRVFVEPLGATALVTSALVLPVLLAFPGGKAIDLAGDLSWLAMIWLVVACTRGWPVLLSAAQVVLASATVAATTAWLGEHPWNPAASGGSGIDLADPRTLQVYGIGLGLFSLAWAVVRLVLRRNAYARELLSWDKWEALPAATTTATVRGDCPNSRDEDDARNVVRRSASQFTTRSVVPHSVDWLVAWAVVAGQLFLGAGLAFLACAHELTLAGPVGNAQRVAFGPAAWGLVGVLALVVLARLWTRWRNADLVFALLVVVTLPYLVAGRYVAELAVASALRWSLSFFFVALVAAIACRRQFKVLLPLRPRTIVTRSATGTGRLIVSHAVALIFTALPVVILTLIAAVLDLNGVPRGGPIATSLFRFDASVSYLLPLLLVTGGLIGLAIRESAAGYAFSAGLVVQMAVVLGYALRVRSWTAGNGATVVQLATIAAAAWAIAWLAARRRIDVWRESAETLPGTLSDAQIGMAWPAGRLKPGRERNALLMDAQIGMAWLGNAVVLLPALAALTFWWGDDWTMAAGAPGDGLRWRCRWRA